MNGYAAVYESAVERHQSFGGLGSAEGIGTVHAAETDGSGHQPGPRTLCGLDTQDLLPVPLDIPADSFETWYPPGNHVRNVCSTCDRLANAA